MFVERPDIIESLKANQKLRHQIESVFNPSGDPEKSARVQYMFDQVKTPRDFREKIVYGAFFSLTLDQGDSSISASGLEKLDSNQAYLFVSNHRDIILDTIGLNALLLKAGLVTARPVVGSNLHVSPEVTAIIKLLRSFTALRSGGIREMYHAAKELSQHIATSLTLGESVWIAQRAGRAKDGFDVTDPVVLKMLLMGMKERGYKLPEALDHFKIVPVSMSYEFDPADRLKAWGLNAKRAHSRDNSEYSMREIASRMKTKALDMSPMTVARREKYEPTRKYADAASVLVSVKRPKGRVHIHIGDPVPSDGIESVKDLAAYIDREIQLGQRFYASAFVAYDTLYNTKIYKDYYSDEEKEQFLARFRGLPPHVLDIALGIYAHPLELYLQQGGEIS